MPAQSIWVPGKPVIASASFTRPADTTAYAANDIVANSVTAGSVVPMSFTIAVHDGAPVEILSARIHKSTTTTANASFNLFLYQSSPTIASGDNAAFSTSLSGHFGNFDIATSMAFSDGAGNDGLSANLSEPMIVQPANLSRVIYGLLRVTAAYAPGNAEVFTVYLHGRSF